MKWIIEYENTVDVGEGFREWWIVTDGHRKFNCYTEDDATWLATHLNLMIKEDAAILDAVRNT